jgi:hypothetical protein
MANYKSTATKTALVSAITSALAIVSGSVLAGECDPEGERYCKDDCDGEFSVAEAGCNHELADALDECDAWWFIGDRADCRRIAKLNNSYCISEKNWDRRWCYDSCKSEHMIDCS